MGTGELRDPLWRPRARPRRPPLAKSFLGEKTLKSPSFGASYFAILRLPSRQALKALRNPFHSPLPNPLRVPLQTRHLHNLPAPFAGPPSYATLARRFSASSPNPVSYFAEKAAKEAIERGQFVDIHDVVGV